MIKTEKWINRTAVAMLSTAVSVTAFAAAPGAPDFLMHKASVKFKISSQGNAEINKDTIKTQDVINILMGRDIDQDGDNSETLGMVTACDVDVDAVALVVYDKNNDTVVSDPSDAIVLDIAAGATDFKDNGDPKKTDLLAGIEVGDAFLTATGTVKYSDIGKKVADDDKWDRDAVCAKNFSSKSVDGVGLFGDVVMSGKISAGNPQFAADFNDGVYPGGRVAITKTAVEINGDPAQETIDAADDLISYEVLVENVGDIDLTNVTVSDPTTDTQLSCNGGGNVVSLVPGESVTCIADRTVTQAEIDTACAVTIEPPGPVVGSGTIVNIASVTSDQTNIVATAETVDVDCFEDPGVDPAMAISKSYTAITCGTCGGDQDTVQNPEDTVDYEVVVRNLSVDVLNGVTVDDTLTELDCGAFDGTLAADDGAAGGPDEVTCTGTYTVSFADIQFACNERDGTIWNVAVTSSDTTDNFAADELVPVSCD